MNKDVKALYQSVILQHNKAPYHYEKVEQSTHEIAAYNPLCGDKFVLYLTISDHQIASAHFHGYGCAISKASTSILVQQLEGKTPKEAAALIREYLSIVLEGAATDQEEFQAFAVAQQFPGREQCATLSWQALEQELPTIDQDDIHREESNE